MVHKGLVMEYTKDYIIVLTDEANYIKLKNKGNIDVGKKIMFIDEDIIKEKNNYVRPFIGVVAAVILLMTVIIGRFGINLIDSSAAYAIVSLDINPSLEFQIDKKEIVKKIKSLNDDGEELIDNSMIGMKIEDAITLSIKKALNKNYLNNSNNMILISDVIMDDGTKAHTLIEKKIFKMFKDDNELENIDVIYVDSDKEDLEKARENQVSIGKYKVYEIVSKNNPNVKINDIKEKKVSEIVRENKELTNSKKVKTKKKKKDNKREKEEKKKNREKEKLKKGKSKQGDEAIEIKKNKKKDSKKDSKKNKKINKKIKQKDKKIKQEYKENDQEYKEEEQEDKEEEQEDKEEEQEDKEEEQEDKEEEQEDKEEEQEDKEDKQEDKEDKQEDKEDKQEDKEDKQEDKKKKQEDKQEDKKNKQKENKKEEPKKNNKENKNSKKKNN